MFILFVCVLCAESKRALENRRKEYRAENWLKEVQESMDRCAGCLYITEIILRTVLSTIQSNNQSVFCAGYHSSCGQFYHSAQVVHVEYKYINYEITPSHTCIKVTLQILGRKFYKNTKKSYLYSQSLLIFIHKPPVFENHPTTREITDLLRPRSTPTGNTVQIYMSILAH